LKSRRVIACSLLLAGLLYGPNVSFAASRAQEMTDYAEHYNHGGELMQLAQYHGAVEEFREAIRLNTSYLPAHEALAIAYAITRHFDLAWQEVEIARDEGGDLNERFVRVLGEQISRDEAKAKREANARELEQAKQTVAREGDSATAHGLLSRALTYSGDFPSAEAEADLALKLNPLEPEAHFVLGTMLIIDPPTDQQGLPHLKLYLQNVAQTSSEVPDVALVYELLSNYYAKRKMEPEALHFLQEGLKIDPENSHLLNSASWLYATAMDASLRNPAQALELARKAVAITREKNSAFLDTLGEALYASGRFNEAVVTEKKAIALAPDMDLFHDQLKKFQNAAQKAGKPEP
jgi:tetratricopeptide (TPR) repeat protein